jgi:GTPase SAR1 family protein
MKKNNKNSEEKKKIIVFKNKDKDDITKSNENAKFYEIKNSDRILICGAVHSGKSNLVRNLIAHSADYDYIYYMSVNETDYTPTEYNNQLNLIKLDLNNIPDVKKHGKNDRVLFIFDDFNSFEFNKKEISRIDYILRYLISHSPKFSLIMCVHYFYQLPRMYRSRFNMFILINTNVELRILKTIILDENSDNLDLLMYKYKSLKTSPYDSLTIDLLAKEGERYRFNLFELIHI